VQGTLINVGKESEEYVKLTSTMTMDPRDMQEIGLAEGQKAVVRTEFGEAEFICQGGKVPRGMIFVPYGPPTCKLMGGDTDGTGMPTSKGWEVEVVPV
jgi:formylmethanofuran dehydrogenase subunit D